MAAPGLRAARNPRRGALIGSRGGPRDATAWLCFVQSGNTDRYYVLLQAVRMRVTSKGQVTIPLAVRRSSGSSRVLKSISSWMQRGARLVRVETARGKAIVRGMRRARDGRDEHPGDHGAYPR